MKLMQRLFDLFFSFIALIILFPLLFVVVTLLRFTGENEIFYRQLRVGRFDEILRFEFATMLKNSQQWSWDDYRKDDPRILPMGRFLKKTKINELPQLINILVGEIA